MILIKAIECIDHYFAADFVSVYASRTQSKPTFSLDAFMTFSDFRNVAVAASIALLAACTAQTPDTGESTQEPSATEMPATAPAAASGQNAPAEPAAPAMVAANEAAPAAGGPGEAAYKQTCAMCHGTTALGAPMLGKKDDWHDRIAQGKDTLYKHALEGFSGNKGVMPAKGGNPSLDDEAVKAAVDYMTSQSQ